MSLTVIRSVDAGSPARDAGIRPGETLTKVNGHPIVDVMDYKYYTYDARLELTLTEPGGSTRTVRVRKEEGEDLGLNFETYLMDRARSCANNCIFCFVDQMPPGMRETLYFKDDDARLSFLMGNYITLTNLSEREQQRIMDLHISPINVSVHATDPALRTEMLKNRNAGKCLDQMKRFAQAGITMNCQIVSCPGVNDGPALERTLTDLAGLYPQVNSVSVVPVGLTKFREGLCHLDGYTAETAAAVLDQVEAFAKRCMDKLGTSLVWCSDEFYLKAGRPLPEDEYYEEYTQLENGVGMLRLLEVEFRGAMFALEGDETPPPFSSGHRRVRRAPHRRSVGEAPDTLSRCARHGLPGGEPLLRRDHQRGRAGHRPGPDGPAEGQGPGGAAAHPRQHAPLRRAGVPGRRDGGPGGGGPGGAHRPGGAGRRRPAGRHAGAGRPRTPAWSLPGGGEEFYCYNPGAGR